jgi:DNA-binding response OmpR family regulator
VQKTILVADSDTSMQLLLFRLFAEAGHVVTAASHGAEAIARIESERPDVIVAHVDLPGKSGAELSRYAKDRPDPIPVVLLVPGGEAAPVEPADAVIGLPIDAQRALEVVRGVLHVGGREQEKAPDKLLVIDDDLGILNLLENLLANEGYEVATADCGREGLAAIERDRPDLVLLDVQMPGMSGFEVLSTIRERHPDLPIIMVTGYGSEDVATQALRLGADDYLAKPLRIRNISFRIESNLERSRLRASQQRLNRQLRQTTLELTERLEKAHAAETSVRGLLARILEGMGSSLAEADAGRGAVELTERVRVALEADDPVAALEAIATQLDEASTSPAGDDAQSGTGAGASAG